MTWPDVSLSWLAVRSKCLLHYERLSIFLLYAPPRRWISWDGACDFVGRWRFLRLTSHFSYFCTDLWTKNENAWSVFSDLNFTSVEPLHISQFTRNTKKHLWSRGTPRNFKIALSVHLVELTVQLVSLCVCVLTRVAQIVTAGHRLVIMQGTQKTFIRAIPTDIPRTSLVKN